MGAVIGLAVTGGLTFRQDSNSRVSQYGPASPSAESPLPAPARTAGSAAGGPRFQGALTEPYLFLDPSNAAPGQVVTVRGQNFCPTSECQFIRLTLDGAEVATKIEVSGDGAFSADVRAAAAYGMHQIVAEQAGKTGLLRDAKPLIVGRIEIENSNEEEPKEREYFPPPPVPDVPRPAWANAFEFQPNIGWGGRAVAVDVNPINASEAWAAAETGGLFKTSNGGTTWAHYAPNGQFRMFDVKYASADGQRVIATSAYDTRVINGGGILVSSNGGASWSHPATAEVACPGTSRAQAFGIAVVIAANEVYVGTDCGLAISRDGGSTWSHVSNWTPGASRATPAVIARVSGANRIIDICGAYGHRRSLDSGVSWTNSTSLPGNCITEVHGLATSPIEPNVILATTAGAGAIACGGVVIFGARVYESDDGGANWTPISARFCPNRPTLVGAHLSRDNNPANFDAYVGDGVGMQRQICGSGGPGPRCGGVWSSVVLAHPDPNAIAWGPTGNCPLYVMTDGGPSTTADCGASWTEVGGGNNGFQALQLYEVANQVHPTATDVYFGTQDNSLWASSDNGNTWPSNTCCEGFNFQLGRSTPTSAGQTIAYTACGACSNLKSEALFAGQTGWNNPPGGGGSPIYIDTGVYLQWSIPNAPTNTVSQLYLSINTGGSWMPVSGAMIAESLNGPAKVSGSAANPTLIQAFNRAGGGIGLRRVTNTRSGTPAVSAELFPGSVVSYCMAQGTFVCPPVFGVNPAAPNHVIVADRTTNAMRVSTDGGASWQIDLGLTDLLTNHGQRLFIASANPLAHVIQWDPVNTARIYVGSDDGGVIASFDSGVTWARLNESTGIVNASNFAFDEVQNRVLAASYGRGLWRLDLSTADISVAKSAPAVAGAQIRYAITVTNNGPLLVAENAIMTDTLPAGTTFARLSTPGETSGWECVTPAVGASGSLTCRNAALFSTAGPQVFNLVVDVDISVADMGVICNVANGRSDNLDTSLGNNTGSACSVVQKIIVDRGGDSNEMACTAAPNDCTLRGAINKVHLLGATGMVIRFNPGLVRVTLDASLPALTATGTSIAGLAGVPVIDGIGIASGPMFRIDTDEARISGLDLVNAPDINILVASGQRNEIDNNTVGFYRGLANCGAFGSGRFSSIGIEIDADGFGGVNPSVWIHDNLVACNSSFGIIAYGGDDVVIGITPEGSIGRNWVGMDVSNNVFPNGVGIGLLANGANGARRNRIRNNVIAHNNDAGVWLNGTGVQNLNSTASNNISANIINNNGKNNGAGGIYLSNAAFFNGIGGSNEGDDNLIYANAGNGISHYSSDFNAILGNQIGATQDGQGNNTGNGILIDKSDGTWVGGIFVLLGSFERGNIIGGNTLNGVLLANEAKNTTITGNRIGVDGASVARPNGANGVAIQSGAYSNTVGGETVARINIIVNNGGNGIAIEGSTTSTNTITLNDIGVNSALLAAQTPNLDRQRSGVPAQPSLALPNQGYGIALIGAFGNSVRDGNYIAHNGFGGILATSGAHHNVFGPGDSIFRNAGSGIEFAGAATQWNRVMTEAISYNGRDGIEQYSGAANNAWVATETFGNGGLGIDLEAEAINGNIPSAGYPVITSVLRSAGNVTLIGTSDATYFGIGDANTTRVYIFHGGLDPSGYGEGQTFDRELTTDVNGIWQTTLSEGATPRCYAAYNRSFGFFFLGSYDYGSEFSPSTCVPKKAHLPRILR